MSPDRLIVAVLGVALFGCAESPAAPAARAGPSGSLRLLAQDPFVQLVAERAGVPSVATALDAALVARPDAAATEALAAARDDLAHSAVPAADPTAVLLRAALSFTLDRVAAGLTSPDATRAP